MRNIWLQRLMKINQKYQQMMRGRYGRFDQLNKTLLIIWLILSLFKRWIPFYLGDLLGLFILGIIFYRFFSKKIYPRSNENQKLIKWWRKLQSQRQFKYFKCPNCKQEMRAPRGKGKIKVTCKNCQNQFIKKV
ncbi:hypothetical protein [Enterococcus sp. AZ103]|uniref:hypothetical protein n=1 Tax=Enterococcus sp. AZ103 TaxID=2774628 RepID=UPI003F262D57